MNKMTYIMEVVLAQSHQPTGKTHHFRGGKEILSTASLKIGRYLDSPGFYLLHFDVDGYELTDTCHETLEDAIAQAEWEYGIKKAEWKNINSPR